MTPPKARILCIEDNPVNWRLVQRLLAQAGYELTWAEEGLHGFEMAVEGKPDLILLDINLPGLSGFEVATKLRQHPDTAKVPVVALTAKTQKSDRETALVAGCTGFITKPIDPFTFVDDVAAYLGGRRDRVEESREGDALRQFSHQIVEHLEAQLRDAQEANRKLLAAQTALEVRNRSLSRLLHLSRSVLTEHDAGDLLDRTLQALAVEMELSQVTSFQVHPSGSFLEGLRWSGGVSQALPSLPAGAPFPARLASSGLQTPLAGENLLHSRFWDEGMALGLWQPNTAACLLAMRGSSPDRRFAGFLALARAAERPWQQEDVELAALHGSLALSGLENAGLISSLNESSRALAGSYERLESAYQELQAARVALGQKERQGVLGEIFLNMAQRLERPVAQLTRECEALGRFCMGRIASGDGSWGGEAQAALAGIQGASAQMDSLLTTLLRRAGRAANSPPEWLDLHDLISQELLFLDADGSIPEGVEVTLDLAAPDHAILGIYSDFAEIIANVVSHALSGPDRSTTLQLRTASDPGLFRITVRDEGGPLLPERIASAFEPFTTLREIVPVLGVRNAGEGLPACAQTLAAYQGRITLRNEGSGTVLEVEIPLQ